MKAPLRSASHLPLMGHFYIVNDETFLSCFNRRKNCETRSFMLPSENRPRHHERCGKANAPSRRS